MRTWRIIPALLAAVVVMVGAMVTAPSAQAGFFCDTAWALCEIAPTNVGKAKCEELAAEVCSMESSGRRADAERRLERLKREVHS